MSFQQNVNLYPSPGVVGARASQNPVSTVDAGQGGLVAGAAGTTVGKFAWNVYDVAGGPGKANSFSLTGKVPNGFISNEQQALITVWLGQTGMVIPGGYPVTEMQRGDFWAANPYADAAIDQKVFANLFTGDVLAADAGSFPLIEVGSAAAIASATIAAGSYEMNIITLTSGVVEIGAEIFFPTGTPGAPTGRTFIESFGTFNGTSGTVNLTQAPTATFTTKAFTTLAPVGVGGGVVAATAAGSVADISAVTSGQVAAGLLVQGTGIPAGTYIASLGTFDGTSGTINLSQAITASPTTLNLSAFIETPWYVTAPANVGDNVKIGIKN